MLIYMDFLIFILFLMTCSERYGTDMSILPSSVANYIYGPRTAMSAIVTLRRHFYQVHSEEYDKTRFKWTHSH